MLGILRFKVLSPPIPIGGYMATNVKNAKTNGTKSHVLKTRACVGGGSTSDKTISK